MTTDQPRTWHYGLVARYWAEFNDGFRPHEIPYFQRFIERGGEPALDVACGSGRLLVPYLRAGLDVDGCDVSHDMIAACREKAEREGFSPALWAQPMHELDAPRKYRTIYVCGAFSLGSTRAQDVEALRRSYEHLEPGGTLLVDMEQPYADTRLWALWPKEAHAALPEAAEAPRRRQAALDGSEYALRSRVLEVDPLEQRVSLEMHIQLWRGGDLHEEEHHRIDMTNYFPSELVLMVERAGFRNIIVHGDHVEADATADDDFVVVVAKK